MKLKTLTWNIGGGKLLSEDQDPASTPSYTAEGIDEITAFLKSKQLDVITLQEAQGDDHTNQAESIAKQLGFHVVYDAVSDSHINHSTTLGNAILSRYPIVAHRSGKFINPHATMEWGGVTVTSHDKGFTTAEIDLGQAALAVTTLHLTPLRKFGIPLDSEQAQHILSDVQSKISDNGPRHLIQGDFNIDSATLHEQLPRLINEDMDEISLQEPTTPRGRMYDHIMLRGGKLLDHTVFNNVLTDHYPVMAEIEV